MKTTEYLNLKKPDQVDFYNVDDFNTNTEAVDEKLKELDSTASDLQAKIDTLADRSSYVKTVYLEGGLSVNVVFSTNGYYRSPAWIVGASGASGTILTVCPMNLNAVTTTLTTVAGTLNLGSQTIYAGIAIVEGKGYRLKLSGFATYSASLVSICLPEGAEILYTDIVKD